MSDASTPVSAPWYKSPILHSLIVIAITHTLTRYHIIDRYTEGDVAILADDILSFIGYAAVAVAGVSRIRSPLAPVTLTQKKADTINAAASPETAVPPVAVITDPKLPATKP